MTRFSTIAGLTAVLVVFGVAAANAQAVPAWTLHYRFATGICGGTSFDAFADGRFRLVTNYCVGPRGESTGALSTEAVRRLHYAVRSSNPDIWSTSYESRCIEHFASLSLTRQARGRAFTTVDVGWGCGLTGVPRDLRALIITVRAVAAEVFPGVQLDTTPAVEAVPVAPHKALTIVARNEFAPRTVELGAGRCGGAALSRERRPVSCRRLPGSRARTGR